VFGVIFRLAKIDRCEIMIFPQHGDLGPLVPSRCVRHLGGLVRSMVGLGSALGPGSALSGDRMGEGWVGGGWARGEALFYYLAAHGLRPRIRVSKILIGLGPGPDPPPAPPYTIALVRRSYRGGPG
jgi:hypothetical protein